MTAPLPSAARTALRRSVGVWAFPLLTAAELMNAFSRNRVWAIEWQWTAYWSNTATYVVVPLAAAVATGESVLYRRAGARDLLRQPPERLRGQAGRLLSLGVWALAAHLVGILACGASAAWIHRSWHLPLRPVIPAFAAVLAAVAVGSAIGWRWPSLAAPPLIGLTWLALLTVAVIGRLDVFLRVGDATVSTYGLRPSGPFTLTSSLWWCAVALAGLWVLVRRGGVQSLDLAVGALAIAAAIALQHASSRPFVPTPDAARPVCSSTQPVLCVNPDYRPRLSAYAKALALLARPLAALDPAVVPPRFEQAGSRMAGSPPISGAGAVSIMPSGPVDVTNLALNLVETATGCEKAPTADDIPFWNAEIRLADWLLTSTGLSDNLFIETGRITSQEQARSTLAALRAGC